MYSNLVSFFKFWFIDFVCFNAFIAPMQSCASTGVPSPAGTPPLWRGRRWEERSKRLIDRLQHSSVAEGDNAWLKSAKLLKHFAFELWVQIAGLLLLDFLCSWASVYLLSKCVTQFLTFYAVVPESSLQRRVKLSKASHETFFNTGIIVVVKRRKKYFDIQSYSLRTFSSKVYSV